MKKAAFHLLRGLLWLVAHSLYRVRVVGRERVPTKGGALFVCNHVSFVDALLLIAASHRHVRFMMIKETYDQPWMKPFAVLLGVIPISPEQRPRDMIKSLQTASEAIRAGELVCIFAEGQITRIGQLLPFQRGFERIMKHVDAPIVPVALDGMWGSIFSFEQRRFVWKWPRRFPYPVSVSFGQPMPNTASPLQVREAVQDLLVEAWPLRRDNMLTLPRAFVRTARRHPFRFAMADPQTPGVSFGGALMRAVLLARRLKKIWAGQPMVGLLLPPSVGGALVNHAALLCGKVPVNLNYTVSEQTLASCIQQCELKTVLSSRMFLEKVKLNVPGNVIYLEDVIGARSSSSARTEADPKRAEPELCAPSAGEKLTAFLMAFFLPVTLLERRLRSGADVPSAIRAAGVAPVAAVLPSGRGSFPAGGTPARTVADETSAPLDKLDALATVIFSSGSTGEPKGVMLSHYNIVSNIEQMDQVFAMMRNDRVLGILPFFHSFGFTATLCIPAMLGVGVVYHANPLDAKTIGPLVRDHAVTFLLTTPTFLQLYLRGCTPEDFGSLRVVMTAAEKLPARLVAACEEHFGIRPMEGYGCTECSPAVTLNAPDFRAAGFRQVGAKRGTIGHPLPGMAVRIVDVASGEPLPVGQSGLLLVRGPNVMRGYLGKPEQTAEVLCQGWYRTGDVAAMDEDGFLQITDRLSRFSKIGGEMVPHIKVEEKLHEFASVTEQTFVVAGLPDEKKGERLVVLHKLAEAPLQDCLAKLAQSDLPNLWKPRAEAFFRVEGFPLLGSGKLDLRRVKEVAGQMASTKPESA